MKTAFRTVLLGSMFVVCGASFAADVAGNGGFEDEGFNGPTSAFYWNAFASGGPGTLSERTSVNPIAGGFSQHLVANGADGMGATGGVTQNTADAALGVSLQAGTTVRLSFDTRGSAGPGGVGFYALRILNGTGSIVANTGLQVYFPNTSVAHYTSPPLTVPAFGDAPNDVYYAYVEIVVAAGAFVGSTIEAQLDNVVVEGTLVAGGNGCPQCPADFNQDGGVDGSDVEAFFHDWESGEPCADVNIDGGVDGGDVETFFQTWEFGSC